MIKFMKNIKQFIIIDFHNYYTQKIYLPQIRKMIAMQNVIKKTYS